MSKYKCYNCHQVFEEEDVPLVRKEGQAWCEVCAVEEELKKTIDKKLIEDSVFLIIALGILIGLFIL